MTMLSRMQERRQRRRKRRLEDEPVKTKTRRGKTATTPSGKRTDANSKVAVKKEASAFTKVERPPKTNIKPPKSDMKTDMSEGKSNVSADRGTGTGLPRTIGAARKQAEKKGTMAKTFMSKSGKAKAAVTREDMQKVGLDPNKKSDLTKYLNKRNKLGRKPKKGDFGAKKMMGGGMMKTKGMSAGGKMKAKGYATGGKIKAKGMKAGGKFPDLTGDGKVTRKDVLKGRGVPGMKGGGMKTKGSMAGGKMKTKGYAVGGMKTKGSKKGGKVRGAGIARKGVRPAKMR